MINEMEVVMLEQLVPQDYLLRKIDKHIDFSFIRDLTKDLYCHTNGRPAFNTIFDKILNPKFYPQLIMKKPSVFKQGVF